MWFFSYSLVLSTLHTYIPKVNYRYQGCLFLPLHCTCTFIVFFSELQHAFVAIVCLIDSNFRFEIYWVWICGEIVKNYAKKKITLSPCTAYSFFKSLYSLASRENSGNISARGDLYVCCDFYGYLLSWCIFEMSLLCRGNHCPFKWFY